MNIKKLAQKVETALLNDNTILVAKEELEKTAGFSLDHMIYLGFTKHDLKYMVSHGIAKMGYVKITKGSRVTTSPRYVLIGDTNEKV